MMQSNLSTRTRVAWDVKHKSCVVQRIAVERIAETFGITDVLYVHATAMQHAQSMITMRPQD